LRKYAGWEGDYLLPETAGTPGGATVREQLERAERSFRRRWKRVRLRYTEVGPVARWGLHLFTETRYASWLASVVTFDFGESLRYRRPVSDVVLDHLPTTLVLQTAALLLMYLVAVPLGVWSAVTRWRRTDRVLTLFLFALYATPSFWIATLAVLHLHDVLPVYGLLEPELQLELEAGRLAWWSLEILGDSLLHLILPVAVLAYGGLAALSRYARSGMLEVMRSDYIRTARAQGLSEWRIITRHAVRNGLLPLVTILGGLLPALVGGSIIVETIFSIPGMGLLTYEAATHGDVPLAMGIITVTALMTMAGYFLTDVVHGLLDPRFLRDA
jgi:peptide/nickel transport system permease protein